jgi:hypothetical protein
MNDCPMTAPVCDTGACRGCAKDNECASNVCDVDSGMCIAESAIRYADPNGLATNDCSLTRPCTIASALTVVDTTHPWLRLLPGVYSGAAIMISNKTVRIVGSDATIIPTAGSTTAAVVATTGANASIRGLVVDTRSNTVTAFSCAPPSGMATVSLRNVSAKTANSMATPVWALDVEKLCSITIDSSDFTGLTQFIDGSVSIVDRSLFSGNLAVSASTSISLRVTNSVLIDPFLLPSLTSPTPGTQTLYFAYNTAYSTFGFAVDCPAATSTATSTYIDNIFYAPNANNAFAATTSCTADTNVIYPHAAAANPGSNAITLDPKLVDAANGNFHLQTTSPAIDMAKPTANDPPVDIDGTTRPQGAAYDIGAYEYKP